MIQKIILLAQTAPAIIAGGSSSTTFDLNAYNAAQPWDISKIMNFGYAGYHTFLIIVGLLGLIGIAGMVITLATSGENSGRQRFAIGGLVLILVCFALAFLGPWLVSIITQAAYTASQ